MIKRSRSSLGSNPITGWSVMHWALTPRGMLCPQAKKTTGTFRPLEHGVQRQRRSPDVVSAAVACRGLEKETRAEIEAGTRQRQGRWEPTHGEQQDQPSLLTGSGSSEAPR